MGVLNMNHIGLKSVCGQCGRAQVVIVRQDGEPEDSI